MSDGPVGTREHRIRKALYWHVTTDKSLEEIGDELGVSRETARRYVQDTSQAEEVHEAMNRLATEARITAVTKLRQQLREAGEEAKTAETPVKVWTDETGALLVREETDSEGRVLARYPVPDDIKLGADQKVRYFRRKEVRELLDLLCDLVGANEQAEIRAEPVRSRNGDIDSSMEGVDESVEAVIDTSRNRLSGDTSSDRNATSPPANEAGLRHED